MAPLTPHWAQPSHPDIQEVLVDEAEFGTKSISKISLPPFGYFAKLAFPPCTLADEPTYATVQIGPDQHIHLNSDLLYINHSCEPSLVRTRALGLSTEPISPAVHPSDLRHGQLCRPRRPQRPAQGGGTDRP